VSDLFFTASLDESRGSASDFSTAADLLGFLVPLLDVFFDAVDKFGSSFGTGSLARLSLAGCGGRVSRR
jgi:hypothetical protein